MATTQTTRLSLYRWSDENDLWSRAQWDSNSAQLEALAAIATQGLAASRPDAGVQRRLYLATDTAELSIDTGTVWVPIATVAQVNAAVAAHVDDTVGAHHASAVSFTPTGQVAATTVQGAVAELDAEKQPLMAPTGSYTTTGTADRALATYVADPETAAYTGGPADLAAAAKVADLNALRVAYENLRVAHEDLRGMVVGVVTDLKTLNLLG